MGWDGGSYRQEGGKEREGRRRDQRKIVTR